MGKKQQTRMEEGAGILAESLPSNWPTGSQFNPSMLRKVRRGGSACSPTRLYGRKLYNYIHFFPSSYSWQQRNVQKQSTIPGWASST